MGPDVAPMMVGMTFFIVTGLVLVLRPISKRLGSYLEVIAEERRRALSPSSMNRDDLARMTGMLESMEHRLAQIEERQEFTDKLLHERPRKALTE